jgi:ribosomal-protein-alanine N-acetyltransferase
MDDVMLRPIEEADLDDVCRFSTDPQAGGEFEWIGFRDIKAVRRRWEQDGWIGVEETLLAVARSDATFAGIVNWKDRSPGTTKGLCYEVGIALLPEHRGQGVGTIAQRLLVQYLFDNTPVHRIQAYTEVDNVAEQRALEKAGFQREGVVRQIVFRAGQWRDSVLYASLRDRP